MMEEELICINLALTETQLNASIHDSEIVMEGFQFFRADRDQNWNGSVALHLRVDTAAETIEF